MTPDLSGDYFEQVQVSTSVNFSKFFGGSDALKVINERCIAMSCNVAKVHSPITLNKSEHSKCKFCITRSWKKHTEFFQQTFELSKSAKGETRTA